MKSMSFAAHFDTSTWARAQRYHSDGLVLSVSASGDTLVAQVSNGRGDIYQQAIGIEAPSVRYRNGRLLGICSCPVHTNCKHVAAALLAWSSGEDRQSALPQLQVSGAARMWLGRARALPGAIAEIKPTPDPRPADYPATIKDRLLYVLVLGDPHLKIDLYKGRINAQGTQLNTKMSRYPILFNLRSNQPLPGFLRPVDIDLVGKLAHANRLVGQSTSYRSDLPDIFRVEPHADSDLIRHLCETGRLLLENHHEAVLSWSDHCTTPELGWSVTTDGRQNLHFMIAGQRPVQLFQLGVASFWLDPQAKQIGSLAAPVPDDLIRLVRDCPALEPHEVRMLAISLPKMLGGISLPLPHAPGLIQRQAQERKARLVLTAAKARKGFGRHRLTVSLPALVLRFLYDGHEVSLLDETEPRFVEGSDLIVLARDPDWEEACLERLRLTTIPVEDLEFHSPTDQLMDCDFAFADDEFNQWTMKTCRSSDALDFAFHTVPALSAEGWDIDITAKWPFRLAQAETQLLVETRPQAGDQFEGHGWFDLGFQVEINGKRHDMAPLIAAFLEQLGADYAKDQLPDPEALRNILAARPIFIDQGKGSYTPVDLSPIAPALHLFLRYHIEAGRLHPTDATVAAEAEAALAGSGVRFADHAGILPLARSLQALRETAEILPPRGLHANLRSYQSFGAAWMGSLITAGFGAVLADDMGLGKTLQVLTLLQARREQDPQAGSSLLVVPTSLLHVWQTQAAQFTPQLRVLILHGTGRKALLDQIAAADLVITTYPLLARDREILKEISWALVIVDEAQTLKNPAAQMAKALRDIPAKGRLALTGTPMENSLQDLWTLFDWVVPGLLGDRKTFQTVFRTPIEKHGDAAAQARLNRRLRPFLLRRTKEEVATELPPRTEIIERVEFAKPQQALYETVRSIMDIRVRDAIAARGIGAARITILDALLKLRQVCCDPLLVKIEAARDVRESAKRSRLKELLQELVLEGRRVLVFSQFVEMLDLISADLTALGIAHLSLTGQTQNRSSVLQEFSEGDAPVFLLSLKAGGVGLTLTQADTVILYDPWWNPAVERQAMDRAHRIGQDKPVFIHRLVAAGTVEEKILRLQEKKKALANALFTDDEDAGPTQFLDEAALTDLFAPLET